MLNGTSYSELVKDFWVKSEVYDQEAATREEAQKILENQSLKGNTRSEMGLLEFKGT